LGAQEAPQNFLELSLIGKAKIDQGFLKGPLCAGALLKSKKNSNLNLNLNLKIKN
jgi:hypothetical protein